MGPQCYNPLGWTDDQGRAAGAFDGVMERGGYRVTESERP
jgi:hypothetical protein